MTQKIIKKQQEDIPLPQSTAMYVSQKKKVKIIIVNVILNQAMFHESQSVKLTKDIWL